MALPRLLTPKWTYTIDYPQAVEFADTQLSIFWTPDEIEVEKDVQDLLINMTEAERHGVLTTLKLFTLYELSVGSDYWLGRVRRMFKRPDIERMATAFGFMEINVHAPFYNKINEALLINTDEFYESYAKDKVLKERMEHIGRLVLDERKLFSLGAFSMVEGAILYSNFAFLKHFQAKGKNRIANIVSGLNFSVRDENLHAEGGAWLYRTLLAESNLSPEEVQELEDSLKECAKTVYEHEAQIISMIFEKGYIEGITEADLLKFVRHRLNLCLLNLGIEPIFEDDKSTISDWFYDDINMIRIHDFFATTGSEYNRNYSEEAFTW